MEPFVLLYVSALTRWVGRCRSMGIMRPWMWLVISVMLHQVGSKKQRRLWIAVRRIMVETGRRHLVSGMQRHKNTRLIKDSALAVGSLSSIILGYSCLVHLFQCTHSSFLLIFFSLSSPPLATGILEFIQSTSAVIHNFPSFFHIACAMEDFSGPISFTCASNMTTMQSKS